jgi:hypothetical protein
MSKHIGTKRAPIPNAEISCTSAAVDALVVGSWVLTHWEDSEAERNQFLISNFPAIPLGRATLNMKTMTEDELILVIGSSDPVMPVSNIPVPTYRPPTIVSPPGYPGDISPRHVDS